jgi:hypothetical protein
MAYPPTGYKRGRPRKGEIRPESPSQALRNKWNEANPELFISSRRAAKLKHHMLHPEAKAAYQKSFLLRQAGWKGTTIGVPMFDLPHHQSGVLITRGFDHEQVINVAIDDYEEDSLQACSC